MTTATQLVSDVGSLMAELRAVIDRREKLASEDKALSERKAELEHHLLAVHEESGLDSFSGAGLTISFDNHAMRAKYEPEKWPQIVRWAIENNHDYIVQRRLSDGKVLELVENGVPLPPGLSLESYVKMSVRRK